MATGFTDELLRKLANAFAGTDVPVPAASAPAVKLRPLRDAHWMKPELVAEVFIRGRSNSGALRKPSLKTLQLDKSPNSL